MLLAGVSPAEFIVLRTCLCVLRTCLCVDKKESKLAKRLYILIPFDNLTYGQRLSHGKTVYGYAHFDVSFAYFVPDSHV